MSNSMPFESQEIPVPNSSTARGLMHSNLYTHSSYTGHPENVEPTPQHNKL